MDLDLLGLVGAGAAADPPARVLERPDDLGVGLHDRAQLRGGALVGHARVADQALDRIAGAEQRPAPEERPARRGAGGVEPLQLAQLAPVGPGAFGGAAQHLADVPDLARELAGLVAGSRLFGAQPPQLLPVAVGSLVGSVERVADLAGPFGDRPERATDARADRGPDDDPDLDVVGHGLGAYRRRATP